jgi:REP element-mobilizing transposase RayT
MVGSLGEAMTVIAYHLIWTNYGTWLPNDPRGSGSKVASTSVIAELGDVHLGRKKLQPVRGKIREFYKSAEPLLRFPVMRFDAEQRSVIAEAFGDTIRTHQYTCYACAIMPDHAHLVIRKHKHDAEAMIDNLQSESKTLLIERGAVPNEHPVWTKGGWKVFLDTPEEVWPRIRYVEGNPMKEGLPKQSWPFVVPYDNWPLHKRRQS